MSQAFFVTARAFRAAIRKHEFSEPQWRIVDVILFYSYERGRYKALIPKQSFFGLMCGKLSKGKISEELTWLETQKVLERETVEVVFEGRKRYWVLYSLRTPEQWRVPLRVAESAVVTDVESWLERLDLEQGELLPPPDSLNDLLNENFVERLTGSSPHGDREARLPQGSSRVEVRRSVAGGSPGGNSGVVESKLGPVKHGPMVPQQGTNVESQGLPAVESPPLVPPGGTSQVPPQGTDLVPLQGTRARGSNRSTRFDKEESNIRFEYGTHNDWLLDPYVREKLGKAPSLSSELTAGNTPLAHRFARLFKMRPDAARELLGTSLGKNRPAAWLNRAVDVELGMRPNPIEQAEWRPGT